MLTRCASNAGEFGRRTEHVADPVYGTVAPLGSNPTNSVYGSGLALGSAPVVAGTSETDNNGPLRAIRWTLSSGTQHLGSLFGPAGNSAAFGISDDTSTIIGQADVAKAGVVTIQHDLRWTAAEGMADLGSLAGPTGNSRVGRPRFLTSAH